MAEISAALVKQLRDKTGAGMGACKQALSETGGDLEKAVDYLRSKNVKMDQTQRAAAEGAVLLRTSQDSKAVAIVELRCETDFAARSEGFQRLLSLVADAVLERRPKTLDEARAIPAVATGLQEANAITIRENVVLSCAEVRTLQGDGRIGTYVHHNGKVGVAVAAKTPGAVAQRPELAELLKNVAMHATAHHPSPLAVTKEAIPADVVARERAVALRSLEEDPKLASKPADIKEKMIDGKLRKFYEDHVLLEQKYVRDPNETVGALLTRSAKDLGGAVSIDWFVRRAVGE